MEKTCQFCLKPGREYELIGTLLEDVLGALLIPLDKRSQESIICKDCLKRLYELFDFKTICLYTEDALYPFFKRKCGKGALLNLRSVYSESRLIECEQLDEKPKICRLCLEISRDSVPLEREMDKDAIKDVFEKYFPEISFYAVERPLICEKCLEMVYNYKYFVSLCDNHEDATKKKNKQEIITIKRETQSEENVDNQPGVGDEADMERKPLILDVDGVVQTFLKICKYNRDRKSIGCCKCTYECEGKSDMLRHLTLHATKRKCATFYKCPKESCTIITTTKEESASHIMRHFRKIVCMVCGLSFEGMSAYKQHKKTHGIGGEWKCNNCTYVGHNYNNLRAHVINSKHLVASSHKKLKLYKCPKKNCTFKSTDKCQMDAHSMRSHCAMECFVCGETLDGHKTYRLHLLEKHKNGPNWQCNRCSFSTTNRDTLKRHVAAHSDDVFKCGFCDYETKYKYYLRSHEKQHGPKTKTPKMYYCHDCSFSTKYKQSIEKHVLVHMSDTRLVMFRCDICKFATKHQKYLKLHKLTHGEGTYPCPRCGNMFRTPESRRMHVTNHHGEKVLKKCSECDFSASDSRTLVRHAVVHGCRQVVGRCPECPYRTNINCLLKSHVSRCHRESTVGRRQCRWCLFRCDNKRGLALHARLHNREG